MTHPAVDPPIGFIGLGVMGSLLAQRLLTCGYQLILYNRTPTKADALVQAGATRAQSPAHVARTCRHVFIAVTGTQALTEVLFGADGVLSCPTASVTHICDLSTQDPQTLRNAQSILALRGIALLEAPMAGSTHDASHGTLQLLLGGDQERLEELRPYFACWGPEPIYFGPLSSAATAKLALNLLLALMATGLSDALTLLKRSNLDQRAFIQVLSASGLRSPLYERLWQRHDAHDYAPRFALSNLIKDVNLCLAHPDWQSTTPATLKALASRLNDMPSHHVPHDYSFLLHPDCS